MIDSNSAAMGRLRALAQVADFLDGKIEFDDLPEATIQHLYEHYLPEMPYGVAKARTGDPYQWIQDRLERDANV
jgi:hypothetical protein